MGQSSGLKGVCDPAAGSRSSVVLLIPTAEPHAYLSTESISVCPLAPCRPSQNQHGLAGGYGCGGAPAPVQTYKGVLAGLDKSAPDVTNTVPNN